MEYPLVTRLPCRFRRPLGVAQAPERSTREHCLAFRRCASDFGLLPNIHKRECTSGDDDRTFLYYLYDKLQGKKRFVVERTNAWVKSFKRLRFRFDYKASSFEAFLYLAIIVICVRRLLP